MSCVYLLHIDPPFQGKSHYVGYTGKATPQERFQQHLKGQGANLTKKAVKAGHKLTLVKYWWDANMKFEYRLKKENETSAGRWKFWCPNCDYHKTPIPVPFAHEIGVQK